MPENVVGACIARPPFEGITLEIYIKFIYKFCLTIVKNKGEKNMNKSKTTLIVVINKKLCYTNVINPKE